MSFSNVNTPQKQEKYDWDNIDVGNNQLNHSQNFFGKKHNEHERPNEMELLQQALVKTELNESAYEDLSIGENKENLIGKCTSPLGVKNNEIKKNETFISPVKVKKEKQDRQDKQLEANDKIMIVTGNKNVKCEWSKKKNTCFATAKGAISKTMPPPPQAYLVKDIYRRNREEAEHRRAEEERKKREFHSRPAPNFTTYHEQLQNRKPVHTLTVAVTPEVMKHSREAEEKRNKRLEEWKLKNKPPIFKPRLPTVLQEKPFVPQKKTMALKQCPFKLNTERRLRKRKEYDEEKQKSREEKQKQEEEERNKREEARIKELRKAATFKARPNPFKN